MTIIIKKNHNFDAGQSVIGFGENDSKMYYKIKKKYKNILWDRSKSTCYSETNLLLQGTGSNFYVKYEIM